MTKERFFSHTKGMEFTPEEKKELESAIVDKIIDALEHEVITQADTATISDYVLTHIDTLTHELEVQVFLKNLSEKWKIFEPLLLLKQGEYKEIVEDEVAEGVLILAQHGKVDEAIKLAKTMTTNSK